MFKIIQGIPPVAFIAWALVAMAATQAHGESYEELRQQVQDQQERIYQQQERIYQQQEEQANDEIDYELCSHDGNCQEKGIDPVDYDGTP